MQIHVDDKKNAMFFQGHMNVTLKQHGKSYNLLQKQIGKTRKTRILKN